MQFLELSWLQLNYPQHPASSKSERNFLSVKIRWGCFDAHFAECMFYFEKSLPCILKKKKRQRLFLYSLFHLLSLMLKHTIIVFLRVVMLLLDTRRSWKRVRLWSMAYWGLPAYRKYTNIWIKLRVFMGSVGLRCTSIQSVMCWVVSWPFSVVL